jgi:hypothetical protein
MLIAVHAEQLMCVQDEDCIAPEFGGNLVNPNSNSWSFGANRQTSVTVFGPAALIESLGTTFNGNPNYTVDSSPEYNYVAIHPGNNYRVNKGITLNLLSSYGYTVVMVGNSTSDWVEPTLGVQCAFVANARISKDITEKAAYVSKKRLVEGVIDILTKLV